MSHMGLLSRYLACIAIACLVFSALVTASTGPDNSTLLGEGQVRALTPPEIEGLLQECPLVQYLNVEKVAHMPPTQGLTATIFKALFPSTPAVNALLATLYISGPPNFLLAACPPNIDPSSLSVMVAFAVGGLLGDTLFHLLPEIFVGEDSPTHVRFVMVEPNRNLLLGLAIMVGFVTFLAMDKILRILTGTSGHSHDYAPGEEHMETVDEVIKASGSEKPEGNLTKRNPSSAEEVIDTTATTTTTTTTSTTTTTTIANSKEHNHDANPSVKLGGYLNLIADFTHNVTDGLALSSSFYASATIGATTTVAVFFHEIPHEVGDFALLIQSGFSKRRAMGAQFVTALGALLGTVIGIYVQEFGRSDAATAVPVGGEDAGASNVGILGTSLLMGDLLLPWTAGTFLYVGTVSVIPELLETGQNKSKETKKTIKQFLAMAAGAGIMLL
ncbi:hypothetical protein KEM54_005551 [Ascosphaera aggregata]|nr:hypothetical protein KEM54_005551 [Ascosphaera aggregata]